MVDQITFYKEMSGAFALPAKDGGEWMPDEAHLDGLGLRFERAVLDMSVKDDQGFTVTAVRAGTDTVDFHRVSDDNKIVETKPIAFTVETLEC